jgi:DNA mismatch repair protein MutL
VQGGKIDSVKDCGDAPGTQIEVRSLFYNLPARRKFLRTENTESSHVEHQLHLQAIGHPEIGFVFLNDDRLVYQLPPTADLRERIRDLCGAELAAELLPVPDLGADNIRIRGFIGKAGVSRSSRVQQLLFLNGRAVENSTLNFALREGYHTALMKGQHPVTFLFVEMDPAAVDVNVHPAKREVRFRNSSEVRDALVEAVRRTLETDRGEWSATFRAGGSEVSGFGFAPPAVAGPAVDSPATAGSAQVSNSPTSPVEVSSRAEFWAPQSASATPPLPEAPPLIPAHEQYALRRDWSSFPSSAQSETKPTPSTGAALSPAPTIPALGERETGRQKPGSGEAPANDFKILGVLGKLYVLMENASGLVLVDQHAAHERILFEEMLHRMEQQGVPTQRLLLPLTLQVTPRDADWINQHLDVLNRAGIALEPFGTGTFKVDSLPTFLRGSEPSQLLREIIDDLRETSTQTSKLRLGEDMIAKTVCRHAVKANDLLREPELVRLVQDLLACDLPYCCPHGRPTMIQISYSELEKKFGRKV